MVHEGPGERQHLFAGSADVGQLAWERNPFQGQRCRKQAVEILLVDLAQQVPWQVLEMD